MVAIYLGRQLSGHKHEEIGKTVGLGKPSSVSSAYLLMKERVAKGQSQGNDLPDNPIRPPQHVQRDR